MDKAIRNKVAKMNAYKPTAKMIADAAGVGEDLVYSVQIGRRKKGKAAARVVKAIELLEVGQNNLVEAVRKAVNF